MPRVTIRKLTSHADFERCVEIQKDVWKHEDIDVTPTHQFSITTKLGAILLGAFIKKEMVGFVYSFPALFRGKLCQHSHLLGVLPQNQGLGIGKKLKWAQRKWALKLGYDFITWTVDPLQARNANLNLHALGAVTRTYWSNFYGIAPSLTMGLNLPTDRFLMEWPIRQRRVELRRKNQFGRPPDISRLPRALEGRRGKGGTFVPSPLSLSCQEKRILVELFKDAKACGDTYEPIFAWRAAIRRVMQHFFRRGYRAVDFIFGKRCFYVLEK